MEKQLEILCESCGYQIESLHEGGACPECGRALALSMPAVRRGTAWQNRPSVGGWFDCVKQLSRSPQKSFEALRVDDFYARKLVLVNMAVAAALMAHPLIGVLTIDPARGIHDIWSGRGVMTIGISFAMWWLAALTLLSVLTLIEYGGILFFAARRQWRLLPQAAHQICAHASVAWIGAALLMIVGLSLSSLLPQGGANRVPVNFWEEIMGGLNSILPGLPPLAGFFAGMLWFEWLVYKGVRCCKFANAPTVAAERMKG